MPRAAGGGEQAAGAQCPEHGDKVELYCAQDKKPLCRLCVEGGRHRGHSISPVNEAIRIYQNELKTSLVGLKERKAAFTVIMDNQERKISALKGTLDSLGGQVTEEFAAMRRLLDERERAVRRELAVYAGSLVQPLEGNLRTIQRALITLQKDIIQCQAVANQWDSLRFLQLTAPPLPIDRPREEAHCPAAISAQPCLGLFRGPLQYRVWKEMRSCISPVPASLSLDPDTANPWMELRADLAAAGLGDNCRPLPSSPRRFDPSPCVLASEGIEGGRHYWEVEVGDKTEWALGVARETAERKGHLTLSPQDGYWAVWLRRGVDYRALTSPPTRLLPALRPARLGVYVDYQAGQVSFYNAHDMSHLYTFSATFTEKIYPFFSPGLRDGGENRAPLILFHLRL